MTKNALRQIQFTLMLLIALAIFISTTSKPAPPQDPTIQEIEEIAREYEADSHNV